MRRVWECRKRIKTGRWKIQYVAPMHLSSSAPVDNNDGNGVDRNTSTVPNLVKLNAESNVLIMYIKEEVEEKEEECSVSGQ